MQRHISLLLFVCLAGILWIPQVSADTPDAQAILRQARINQISQEARLTARLRGKGRPVPFEIRLENGEVRYLFSEPDEEIVLRLGDERTELLVRKDGKESPVEGAAGAQSVRGSRLSYEDLALRFLYWPGAKYLGRDSLRTRSAHRIELHPHRKDSVYGAVRVWVDDASGALLRIEGYNWDGKIEKRFEVISARKIQGQWFLRTMRIETFDPATGKVRDRMYLDITGLPEGEEEEG